MHNFSNKLLERQNFLMMSRYHMQIMLYDTSLFKIFLLVFWQIYDLFFNYQYLLKIYYMERNNREG